MHSKIINPKVHGKIVYDNKGTSAFLVTYLNHEVKDKGEVLAFFNEDNDNIKPDEVMHSIDHNVKGLRKTESKFFALVLSPSSEELKHIKNDPRKLKQFTVNAMQHYAENFQLKNSKTITSKNLLWFATIHHDRTYKGTDKEVQEGKAKSSELKPGLNMHAHVVVSKRDREQKITLSPYGNKQRFDMNLWQAHNQKSFNRMFDYRKAVSKIKKEKAIAPERLARMNRRITDKVMVINHYLDKPHQLELKEVLKIAGRKGYNKTFFYNLNRLEFKLKNQQYLYEPMHLLEHNRDLKPQLGHAETIMAKEVQHMARATEQMGFTESIGLWEGSIKKRKRRKGYGRH